MISGAARRRARVEAAVAAYTQSRCERDAVRAAYRVWSAAGTVGEPLAFETYQSALDREQRAATTYASLMNRVGHLRRPDSRISWCSRERGSAMTTNASAARPTHAHPDRRAGRGHPESPSARGLSVEADVARYSAKAEPIMLPPPNARCVQCVQPTSFEHSHRLITHARAAARTALQRSTRRAHVRLVS